MKVRFYVPETDLPKLAIGEEVLASCDNCAADLTAKIYSSFPPRLNTPRR